MFELSDFEHIILEIDEELRRAIDKNPAFYSFHHGYAVILEELEELWDEVKKKKPDKENMKKEVVQVAAMAIRFYLDLLYEYEE